MRIETCHVCESGDVREHERYRGLQRITSDCKPWPSGGRLQTCRSCGCSQVICDEAWQASIQSIYENYTIYYQGGGEEQKVFNAATAETLPRSEWLLDRIAAHTQLAPTGRALDIGCGNGRFLKAFGAKHPNWNLYGTEFDAKYKDLVESLPGVEEMFVGGLETLPDGYDFVSLIHVLEHIEKPLSFLAAVKKKISSGGLLFVELPTYHGTPFELLITDHATHFTLESAARMLEQAGFEVLHACSDWVAKELSLLAIPSRSAAKSLPVASDGQDVESTITWLLETSQQMRTVAAASHSFGILGTSIAAAWLTSELGRVPDFYVDEDPNRIGRTYNGAPILSSSAVPVGSDVFIGQPSELARKIADRLGAGPGRYHVPASNLH